ncbi:MAG: hypothetical protein ACP5XB_12205 [Isosphaeraceae bacterium]
MHRRGFLQTGALGVAAGALTSPAAASATTVEVSAVRSDAPAVLKSYMAEDHRRRLQNIGGCTRAIRQCMRKHLITNYLPAQCAYNLGEYPCVKPWDPDAYDEQELDRLRDHGIQLIQLFDESNDSLRLFGGGKHTPLNPEGLRRFVTMAHRRGIKVITYLSTGYFQYKDPDLKPEWYRKGDGVTVGYWDMVRCAPASPGWRAYLLPHAVRLLDDYGLDGLYDDWGYLPNTASRPKTPAKDEVLAFEETPSYDGAVADLLELLYAEVQRRGGVFKLHCDVANAPQTRGARVYDYLWVGESVRDVDGLREAVKNHPPYVVPCLDMTFTKIEDDDEPYLHAIPYMQFPLLQAGRPWTGERARVPGVVYPGGENDFWVKRCRAVEAFLKTHPDGPYTYGGWDSVPGRAETRPTHARWLKRYLPLVEDGTWAWLEIKDSSLFTAPLPQGVVASAFANRQLHLVLANYGRTAAQVETTSAHVPADQPSAAPTRRWSIGPRSLLILRRTAES